VQKIFEKMDGNNGITYQQLKVLLRDEMDIEFENDEEFMDICLKIDEEHTGLIKYENLYDYWKHALEVDEGELED
jgi:Ca2+-binding EF-hand superfamily protein